MVVVVRAVEAKVKMEVQTEEAVQRIKWESCGRRWWPVVGWLTRTPIQWYTRDLLTILFLSHLEDKAASDPNNGFLDLKLRIESLYEVLSFLHSPSHTHHSLSSCYQSIMEITVYELIAIIPAATVPATPSEAPAIYLHDMYEYIAHNMYHSLQWQEQLNCITHT